MLAYFCFLEQLLVSFVNLLLPKNGAIVFSVIFFTFLQVGRMGTGAVTISLPFSCVLGLLASMTSSTMGTLLVHCEIS